jgi:hypothetical protein
MWIGQPTCYSTILIVYSFLSQAILHVNANWILSKSTVQHHQLPDLYEASVADIQVSIWLLHVLKKLIAF